MESSGADEVMISGSDEAKCAEATVEIKIKTLDSQTYTLRVDKCVPVPALKEQIATVTGVLSEQQRLICRGKVLKDDQLLSAYHVEDGHTLHLVVRQPITPLPEGLSDQSATDPVSSTGRGQGNQAGPSVVVGTFNISEQGDGAFPDLSRIVSAVLGSFGVTNIGVGNEGADLREPSLERRIPDLGALGSSGRQQPDQTAMRSQSILPNGASPLASAVHLEPLEPPVIPDSLTTLSQYLSRMRHEFSAVRGQSPQAPSMNGNDGQESDAVLQPANGRGGLPTPTSLAEVMLSTRQMLIEHAGECLAQLMRQLENHASTTDPLARMSIQSNALRSGALLQNLGALLLELGRTTMTLRMGQTPADAVVNAGPAVFISTSGPNPIMVQPLPFQPGTNFGAIPVGTVQPGSGWSGGSFGSGLFPRNIDVRIRTGSLMPSAIITSREPNGPQQTPGQTNQVPSGAGGNSVHQTAAGASGSPSSTRESEVRMVPIRTVVAAVPANVRRSPSVMSRGSVGLFYPVLASVHNVSNGNISTRGSQASDERQPQSMPGSAVQPLDSGVSVTNGSGVQNDQGSSTNIQGGLDQLLGTVFPGEQLHVGNINFQEMGTTSPGGNGGPTQDAANTQEAVSGIRDEGTFFSNLLREIMPIISQNTASGSNTASQEGSIDVEDRSQVSSAQAGENSNLDRGISSRRSGDFPSPPIPKRQKRE